MREKYKIQIFERVFPDFCSVLGITALKSLDPNYPKSVYLSQCLVKSSEFLVRTPYFFAPLRAQNLFFSCFSAFSKSVYLSHFFGLLKIDRVFT